MSAILETIQEAVIAGDEAGVLAGVQSALDEHRSAEQILNEALIEAMREVGDRYERDEYFVPEMLYAAAAMQAGLELLRPHLVENQTPFLGRIVIGSVKGDLHDIGKNLVAMMAEGAGFEVVDLGSNVSPDQFAEAAERNEADIVAVSALLSTSMPKMKLVIDALEASGIRDKVKVIVGGALVTDNFVNEIGADGTAPDASRAAKLFRAIV
jgi:5-methyltetrahydrofolate--homocysteine methyltransferase